jgi:hypothetical protein
MLNLKDWKIVAYLTKNRNAFASMSSGPSRCLRTKRHLTRRDIPEYVNLRVEEYLRTKDGCKLEPHSNPLCGVKKKPWNKKVNNSKINFWEYNKH